MQIRILLALAWAGLLTGAMTVKAADKFQEPAEITPAKIAALEPAKREVWQQYVARSKAEQKRDQETLAAEVKQAGLPRRTRAPKGSSLKVDLNKPVDFYRTDAAKQLAEFMASYQTPSGGWSKAVGYDHVRKPGESYVADDGWSYVATFDNGATITQIRFLAKVAEATGSEALKASVTRGIEFILKAQFPNGGWPQVYPLGGGYHDAVTYNDNAMVNVLRVLHDAAAKKEGFAFVSEDLRKRVAAAEARGLACILETQVLVDGKRTAWGQQYDALTLKPTSARAYEMISLSSGESAGILRYLMEIESPSPEVIAAVHGVAAWLKKTMIKDFEWKGGELVATPGAGPIWARYREIGTDKALFGDRDRSIHFDVKEISEERRNGYGWYGTNGNTALKEYEKWAKKWPAGK